MKAEKERRGHRERTQGGFSLLIVIGISAVILLLVSTLFMRAGTDRRDRSAQRSTTNSLYAAEAGLNMLAGRLGNMDFGTDLSFDLNDKTKLPYLVASASIAQTRVSGDIADGYLRLGITDYSGTGAAPTQIGDGLGFLVYSVEAYTCKVTTHPCPAAQVNPSPLTDLSTPIDSSRLAYLMVEVVGFQGRSGVASLKARLTPKVQSFLALLPYVAVGQVSVSTGPPSMSAKPFCTLTAGSVDCSNVRYLQQIYFNAAAGGVIYQDSASPNSCLGNSNCKKVTGIYYNPADTSTPPTPTYVTEGETPASNLKPWPILDPNTGKPLSLPADSSGNAFAPYLPEGAIVQDSNGKYALKTGYDYLPSGLQNGTLPGATLPSEVASVTIPSTTRTETITDSTDFSLAPAIQDALVAGGATGADKYEVVQLSDSSGGGVTLKDGHTLTLKPGRYLLSGLNASGDAALIVSPQITGASGRYSDPVVLYLTGTDTSIDIGRGNPPVTEQPSGKIVNTQGAAANLQIYSNTSGTINLRGDDTGSLRALVYAPNAQIVVNGRNRSDEEGQGSIIGTFVGKTVSFIGTGTSTTRTTLIYDESLGDEDSPVRTTRSAVIGNWRRQ